MTIFIYDVHTEAGGGVVTCLRILLFKTIYCSFCGCGIRMWFVTKLVCGCYKCMTPIRKETVLESSIRINWSSWNMGDSGRNKENCFVKWLTGGSSLSLINRRNHCRRLLILQNYALPVRFEAAHSLSSEANA